MQLNETHYPDRYPETLCRVLETARAQRQRVRLEYNDSRPFAEGYIGRSTGRVKIPLVVYNARSMGGSPLWNDPPERVTVRHKRGRLTLWPFREAK